jgi:hypothetical protein
MTKKHFIRLAYHIRALNCGIEGEDFTKRQLEQLAAFCKEQNPRFDRERWLGYIAGTCGPNGGTVRK